MPNRSRQDKLAGLYMNVEDVAALYSVTKRTVYRWLDAGRFPHTVKVGKRLRIPADEATAGLAARQAGQVAKVLKESADG